MEELEAEHMRMMRMMRNTTEMPLIFLAIFELKGHYYLMALFTFLHARLGPSHFWFPRLALTFLAISPAVF